MNIEEIIAKRKNRQVQRKAVNMALKDLDEGSRTVAGYLSTFGFKDSDEDIIIKGAFTKSLQERGVNATGNRRIAFLRMHDWFLQIGKFLELKEDETGLYFVGQLGRSTIGNDAFLDFRIVTGKPVMHT